jgi:DNA-directed RNA polymerase specialized sigma24 family protein
MTRDHRLRRFVHVDRDSTLRELPTVHAVALRLSDRGYPTEVIADAVGIEVDQVPTLLELATEKFKNAAVRPRV